MKNKKNKRKRLRRNGEIREKVKMFLK